MRAYGSGFRVSLDASWLYDDQEHEVYTAEEIAARRKAAGAKETGNGQAGDAPRRRTLRSGVVCAHAKY